MGKWALIIAINELSKLPSENFLLLMPFKLKIIAFLIMGSKKNKAYKKDEYSKCYLEKVLC